MKDVVPVSEACKEGSGVFGERVKIETPYRKTKELFRRSGIELFPNIEQLTTLNTRPGTIKGLES